MDQANTKDLVQQDQGVTETWTSFFPTLWISISHTKGSMWGEGVGSSRNPISFQPGSSQTRIHFGTTWGTLNILMHRSHPQKILLNRFEGRLSNWRNMNAVQVSPVLGGVRTTLCQPGCGRPPTLLRRFSGFPCGRAVWRDPPSTFYGRLGQDGISMDNKQSRQES